MAALRWASWAAELGAIRAHSLNGNFYIVRPAGGWHALYAGGVHMGDYAKRSEAKRAAQRIEDHKTAIINTKGPGA